MTSTLRISCAVVLLCLLLPGRALAGQLTVTPVVKGPGKIIFSAGECGPFAQGDTASVTCATQSVGVAGEVSSMNLEFTAVPNTSQPYKSTFAGWIGCPPGDATGATCDIFSPLAKGVTSVTLTAVFVDAAAPTIGGLTASYSSSLDRTVSFAFTSNDGIASRQCEVDGESAWHTCGVDTGMQFDEGTHSIFVRAIDPSGHASNVLGPLAFRVIDTALAGGPGDFSADRAPTFTFSTLTGVSFECSVDGAAFVACGAKRPDGTGSYTVPGPLSDGAHSFSVRAKDGPDYDHVAATRSWTVDTAAPAVAFTGGPGEGALQAFDHETFAFSAGEPGSSFQCSLDGAPFAACASPDAIGGLAAGAHSFAVRAIDRAGNVGAPSVRTWALAGALAAQPAQPAPRPALAIVFKAKPSRTSTRFSRLSVTGVPAGSRVTVSCTGHGCPKRFVKSNASGTVSLAAVIKHPIPLTAHIKILVAAPGQPLVTRKLELRRSKQPKVVTA